MRLRLLCLAVALLATVPACGSDDDKGSSSTTTPGAGQTVTQDISAAEGGEVTVGDAGLSIPAGALGGDTTVTVETKSPSSDLPSSADLKGLVYDFGPDGTMFSTPATLTLPSVGDVGADKQAVVAWLDESTNTWQDLATTKNADGSYSAEISHFTIFVIKINGVAVSDCTFGACGGDLTGTWSITGACADIPDAANPFAAQCAEATFDVNLELTGSITFNADKTYDQNFTSAGHFSYTLPASCLAAAGAPASCDEMSDPGDPANGDAPTVCTGDPATTGCTCSQDGTPETSVKTGTWSSSGTTLTMTDSDSTEPSSVEYCANGSDGRFQTVESDGGITVTWMATKQ